MPRRWASPSTLRVHPGPGHIVGVVPGLKATGRADKQVELIRDLVARTGVNEIDLVILNDAPPLLGRRIVRAGRRLHAGDAAAVHAFERDVQLRAADLEPFVRRGRARVLEALGACPSWSSGCRNCIDTSTTWTASGRVSSAADLRADLSLHNDFLFSLLTVSQLVIHEYVGLDLDRAVRALDELQPIRRCAAEVAHRERSAGS